MALRGFGPESEAESVRFHERRVTRVGPEVKHGRRRLGGCKIQIRGSIWSFSSACRIEQAEAKTTKDQTILKRIEPGFIEPMQCKPVTALPTDERLMFEIKFDGYRCIAVKHRKEVTLFSRNQKVLNQALPEALRSLEGDFVLDGGNSLPWIRRGDLPSRRYGTTFRERFGKDPLVPPQRSSCC